MRVSPLSFFHVVDIDTSVHCSSTVKQDTATPVWNEIWKVKNVPVTADLVIKVMDKDVGSVTDDFIGTVKTSVSAGAKEADIEGPLIRRSRGTFWLKVRLTDHIVGPP